MYIKSKKFKKAYSSKYFWGKLPPAYNLLFSLVEIENYWLSKTKLV